MFGGFPDESHHPAKPWALAGQGLSLRGLCALRFGDHRYLKLEKYGGQGDAVKRQIRGVDVFIGPKLLPSGYVKIAIENGHL